MLNKEIARIDLIYSLSNLIDVVKWHTYLPIKIEQSVLVKSMRFSVEIVNCDTYRSNITSRSEQMQEKHKVCVAAFIASSDNRCYELQ